MDGQSLKKSMTLTDLVLLGVLSILASGGFNLLGHAVVQAGDVWPLTLAAASLVFMGASKTYAEAFEAHPSNIAESDLVKEQFGQAASATTAIGILIYNLFSISTILVFCSHMMLPSASWLSQIALTISMIAGMSGFALQGIDINKSVLNGFSQLLIAILAATSVFGFGGFAVKPYPSVFRVKGGSLLSSFFYFFFIISGFDALMKFAEETRDPKDIPKSFYLSTLLSILLLLGVVLAYVFWVDIGSLKSYDNPIGEIFQVFLGGYTREIFTGFSVMFMIMTTFVVFLVSTRYLYGLSDEYPLLAALKSVNEAKVPDTAIYTTFGISSLISLLNHTESLLRLTDLGLSIQLVTVAAAATAAQFKAGAFPLIEGATTAALTAVLASVFS
jgi:amino acid transporter